MMTKSLFVPDAWRAAQEPEAIGEAFTIGVQTIVLVTQAATLINQARQSVGINDAEASCQVIVDRLADQTSRLRPVLWRLRAASKAVI